ncbi:MAG TPA: thioesterase family protein [Thermoleophilaceae bacterium]|nr:thioesterase family protein [Thermoleophilaceae bacterium]
MTFDEDLDLRPLEEGSWKGRIEGRWWTPRGPLGGFVMALILRALEKAVADADRQARSLTVQFLRPPAEGAVTVKPLIERAGRGLTNASARLEQDGRVIALGLATFAGPREGPELTESPMPEVEPPGEREQPRRELPGAEAPNFVELLSTQPRFGSEPFSRAANALTGGWIGLREPREVDAAALCVLADAWYPAPWPRLAGLAPAPTVEMSVYFRAPLPQPDALLLGRFRSAQVRDGYFDEDGELWMPDGTLVAQSRQLAILFGASV